MLALAPGRGTAERGGALGIQVEEEASGDAARRPPRARKNIAHVTGGVRPA